MIKRPPKVLELLLQCFLRYEDTEAILGDFEEKFTHIILIQGIFSGYIWYIFQILLSIPKFIKNSIIWSTIMLKNYLKIAVRQIRKNVSYSLINIIGLSVGIACSVLVMLFVLDELSFDRFHEKADRIYRVAQTIHIDDRQDTAYPSSPLLGPTLVHDFPEIIMATRLQKVGSVLVKYGDQILEEPNVYSADADFFKVFSFKLKIGDPERALAEPNSVIITRSIAQKYFGEQDPIGKILTIEDHICNITGIAEDVPRKSHFHFDFLVSINTYKGFFRDQWIYGFCATYIVLRDGASVMALENQFPAFVKKYLFEGGNSAGIFKNWEFFLQPLTDIHLHSHLILGEFEPNGQAAYVTIFGVISLFILLIACINFVNLTTAKSMSRANEVGVRKVVGSKSSQLVGQFLGESVLFSFISLGIAVLLIELLLPLYRNMTERSLEIAYFSDWIVIPSLIILGLVIGVLSGIYPALFLSAFKPIISLKTGRDSKGGHRSPILGNGLTVFQFALSIFLIIGTITVNKQFRFFQNKQLGFDKENVIVLKNMEWIGARYKSMRTTLQQNPDVTAVSATSTLPGRNLSKWSVTPQNFPAGTVLEMVECDYDFQKVLKLEMATGRFFSKNIQADRNGIIINEEAATQLGWENPVGKRISASGEDYEVIGMVKNFHYESLHQKVKKMGILLLDESKETYTNYLCIRIRSGNVPAVIDFIEKTWESFSPRVALNYGFLDADYDNLYRTEMQTRRIATVFSLLAIFISCLGLLGMAAYMAEQRKKEVGIRKVLGASVSRIVLLLNWKFLKWVILANVIAWPIGYFVINQWLQNFAYRIDIECWTFIFSGILALGIAFLSIGYQTFKAAQANPVDSLKYE